LQAYHGQGFYLGRPMNKMSVISVLWKNVVHFVVRNDYVKNKNFSDLNRLSQSFSIGGIENGTLGSEQVIFDALEINKNEDFIARYLDFASSVDALFKNQIAGAVFTGRVPHADVIRLFAAEGDRISLLNVTEEQFAKINSGIGIWSRYVLKAGSYRGQNDDVITVAYPNILVVSDRLTDTEVYQLTKCFYDNLTPLTEFLETNDVLTLAQELAKVELPIHPGAAKYFAEKGFNIARVQ
jgi:TRAP transporter TAXI family solute receptor